MKTPFIFAVAAVLWCQTGIFSATGQPVNTVAAPPVHAPGLSMAQDQLPDGILAWDSVQKMVSVTNGQEKAIFNFAFTNISTAPVSILAAHGSCSCTVMQLPQLPWMIPAGGTGQFGATIALDGKTGTIFKQAIISTDRGTKNLMLRVDIMQPPPVAMPVEERARGIAAAKIDRQAVFKGDCVGCHAKDVAGKYGPQLYDQVCSVCHEASPRATMVPDLHNLKDPTSEEFWRTWITSGKTGTLMPAFATAEGGPLTDMQIASLAAYLNATMPSHAPPSSPVIK